MHFLVNNLAPTDLDNRVDLIRKAVFPDYKDWFANYLVVKRAAQVLQHVYCLPHNSSFRHHGSAC